MSPPAVERLLRSLRRPRNRVLLGLLVLGVAARIALPYLLRPLIISEADAALVGRIVLADLDLSLLRGGVTLHGFEMHVDELPPPAAEGDPAPEVKPPIFAAKRLWTQISWLALLRKTIDIEEFDLAGFSVRLDRLKDGLVLPGAAPGDAPAPAEPEEPFSWHFALDSVAFRNGEIVFRDFTVRDGPQQFDFAVADVSARDLALATDASGLSAGHVGIAAQIGGGSLGLDAQFELRPGGPAATSKLTLAKFPIDGVRVYLAMFGWSDLVGTLDATIEHHFETAGAHEIAGSASLSDVVVSVPNLGRPALAWKKLDVGLEKIDLVKQRVAVADVALIGARITIDPKASPPLPLLVRALAAVEDREVPAPSPEPAAEASRPWSWRVAKLRVADSGIDLLGAAQPLPLALALDVRKLASGGNRQASVKLSLAQGEGSLALDGALGIEPLTFAGELRIADLALAPLLARIDAPGVHWLREGTARAALRVALAPHGEAHAGAAPTDLKASGSLGFAGIDVAEETTAKDFSVAWKDFDVAIRELAIPELIGARDPAKPLAITVALERVHLVQPAFRITRTQDGNLLLPPGTAAPATGESVASESPAPVIRVEVADVQIEGGRARIVDRAVDPKFVTTLKQIELRARGVRWPGPVVEKLALSTRGLKDATLAVSGDLGSADSRLDVKLARVPLERFDRYAKASGYNLAGGALSIDTQATIASDAYDTSNQIVLSHLDISSGSDADSRFQKTFGIPLSVAVGLLEDLDGRIDLAIPLAGDRGGAKVGLAGLVGQALRKALIGALAAPLKLFGAIVSGGKVERLAPEPIVCVPGLAEFAEPGEERIEDLAALLTASPVIALILSGVTAPPDIRWLKEQVLLAELRETSGLRALGNLGEIGTRTAVREYLEAGLAGNAAPLEPAQRDWLEARIAQQSVAPGQLASLAAARAAAAQLALVSEYGIAPERLNLGPPVSDPLSGVPGVAIALGTLPEASP